jgi:acetoacetyl-CoA synthetase
MNPSWAPSAQRAAAANMTRFLGGFRTYEELYAWSLAQPEEFWSAVWRFCGVKAQRGWDRVLQPCEGLRRARWFPGALLNYAANLLQSRDNSPAIIAWNEQGHRRTITYEQLSDEVSRMAIALRVAGVAPGDRVAAWMPNLPETVIAFLATASLGAIWSSCSPDFGVDAVVDRFGQIEPKVMFAADGVQYNGKSVETLDRLGTIVERLPSVKQTIVVPVGDRHPSLKHIPRCLRWEDAVVFYPPAPIRFEELPFEHPLAILYSSGTTGLPKCMVHGAGPVLLEHLKELVLHTDVKPTDRVFYHTTCGWMMWNWLVSVLATGACIVLWDGSPLYPHPGILWELAAEERVTVFGTSAKYLAAIEKQGLNPGGSYDLSALRTILSTGSPLLPESYDYVYSRIKEDVHLASISGGTDIVGCFALGNPLAPVYRGELQARSLGLRVEVFDQAGRAVVGQRGELVCHPPFPSMPLYFWNDPGDEKYRAAYFERYPGVWRHGDWAELTERGSMVISGRSDATLNPGGIRIGTAEIYRQVDLVSEVLESLVISRPRDGDEEVLLFVRLRPGLQFTDELEREIRRRIRQGASPHHVPRAIYAVPDLPRTVSGKLTELAIRDLLQGKEPTNTGALANPEALEYFRRFIPG